MLNDQRVVARIRLRPLDAGVDFVRAGNSLTPHAKSTHFAWSREPVLMADQPNAFPCCDYGDVLVGQAGRSDGTLFSEGAA